MDEQPAITTLLLLYMHRSFCKASPSVTIWIYSGVQGRLVERCGDPVALADRESTGRRGTPPPACTLRFSPVMARHLW